MFVRRLPNHEKKIDSRQSLRTLSIRNLLRVARAIANATSSTHDVLARALVLEFQSAEVRRDAVAVLDDIFGPPATTTTTMTSTRTTTTTMNFASIKGFSPLKSHVRLLESMEVALRDGDSVLLLGLQVG